jgi:hypothetical protein
MARAYVIPRKGGRKTRTRVGGYRPVAYGTLRPLHRCTASTQKKDTSMVIGLGQIQPIVALLAGILILIMPRLLNYIVAAYLIFVGIMGLGLIR